MNGSISPQLAPRRAHGFGATDPFASAKTLLAGSMSAPIAFGDTLLLAGNYAAAIAQYQAAGNAGAAVGNAVKAAGGNAAVLIGTIADNATLQGIPTSAPNSFVGESNAASAQGLAKAMVGLYQQAMTMAATATGSVKTTALPPASGSSSKTVYYVAGGVAAAALGTGAWWLYGRKKR